MPAARPLSLIHGDFHPDQIWIHQGRVVLFDFDEPGRGNLPVLENFGAGVLLEVLKDLLYQAYVRRGRLQQSMMVRRYFAEDSSNVTPLRFSTSARKASTAAASTPT